MTTFLVLGATGKTGRTLVPSLLNRQFDVRAATRHPAMFEGAIGATAVRFDWNDRDTWAAALHGVDGVYLLKPEIENAAYLVSEFVVEMARGGISRLVLHSEVAAETRSELDEERRVELVIERSDLDWTIIRPNWFVQDLDDDHFFGEVIRDKGAMVMTTGGASISWIDNRDISATAVELLANSDLCRHEALTLTGPESLTLAALTDRITTITKHPVVPVEETIGDSEERMRNEGLHEDLIAYLTRLQLSIIDGRAALVTDSVEHITGRRPRSINEFLLEWALRLETYTDKVIDTHDSR